MNYYVTANLDALRRARCSSGYSQREIAERIGMSKIRYQNLENGKYPRTKVESAEAIAVVLQTDPEVIFPMFMSAKAAHDAAEAERVDAENLQAYAVVVDPDAVRSAACKQLARGFCCTFHNCSSPLEYCIHRPGYFFIIRSDFLAVKQKQREFIRLPLLFYFQNRSLRKADIRNPLRYLLMNAVASRPVSGSFQLPLT